MSRERKIRVWVRLNEKEFTHLTNCVLSTGLPRENYLRLLIMGYAPTPFPPYDYYGMMNELRSIGTCFNQIARKANVLKVIDSPRYDRHYQEYKELTADLYKHLIEPRKLE